MPLYRRHGPEIHGSLSWARAGVMMAVVAGAAAIDIHFVAKLRVHHLFTGCPCRLSRVVPLSLWALAK
jgi:hypothetical protein